MKEERKREKRKEKRKNDEIKKAEKEQMLKEKEEETEKGRGGGRGRKEKGEKIKKVNIDGSATLKKYNNKSTSSFSSSLNQVNYDGNDKRLNKLSLPDSTSS